MDNTGMPKKRTALNIAVILLVVGLVVGFAVGHYTAPSSTNQKSISTFAAGSLTYALGSQFNPQFQNQTNIKVGMTFSGSISGAREVQSGKPFSVFISASAPVLYQDLMNQTHYADWQIIFSANEMAITWLNDKYNISSSNPYWFESITENKTIVSASNASLDPSGFQAIETMKLAGILYTNWSNPDVQLAFHGDKTLFMKYNDAWNSWFGKNWGYPNNDSLALYHQLFISKYHNKTFLLTTEEYGMDAYLEAGSSDYAITYVSQAINQHLYYYENSTGGNGLSKWINLGSTNKTVDDFYAQISESGPSWDNVGNLPGAPIFYSVTIISNYSSPAAVQYIYNLITPMGYNYLEKSKFDPLSQPFAVGIKNMPAQLQALVTPPPSYLLSSAYD
ncbi:MAG: extracellular solute-binding protein [Thermoplasmata archaeon]